MIEPKYCIGFRSDRVPSYTFDELRYCDEKPYSIKRTELFPDNICEILFTTGTTDKPKGVCLSYNNVFGSVTNINGYIGNSKSDIEIIGLPICHSFGLGRLRCNLINGQTVVLLENFANVGSFLSCIEKYNVTGFGIVPAAWAYVMKMGGRAISQYSDQIKYIEIGSASMPHEVKLEMLRMFPNTRICMHYGSTEASRSCFMEFHDEKHLDSIGLPVSEKVDIKIFDSSGFEVPIGVSGEICIKGNMVMPHYLSDKGHCDSFWGEYFRTGDTGYKSGDGYYYLLGRTKEIINVGGKKISPSEVEDVICSLGVGDCLCVPMEDPEGIMGEVVKCYVLRNSTTLTFDEIALKLVDKLETYKRPVEYEWIDEIPCTPSGKKQRMNIINS